MPEERIKWDIFFIPNFFSKHNNTLLPSHTLISFSQTPFSSLYSNPKLFYFPLTQSLHSDKFQLSFTLKPQTFSPHIDSHSQTPNILIATLTFIHPSHCIALKLRYISPSCFILFSFVVGCIRVFLLDFKRHCIWNVIQHHVVGTKEFEIYPSEESASNTWIVFRT